MKQAAFLAALALTGSVREAARRVGMRRETAYRLRRKPGGESFADAWDRLRGDRPTGRGQGPARKVTPEGLRARAMGGLLKPLLYRGRHVGTIRKADNSALLRYCGQLDRSRRAAAAHGPGGARFAPHAASTPAGLRARGDIASRPTSRHPRAGGDPSSFGGCAGRLA